MPKLFLDGVIHSPKQSELEQFAPWNLKGRGVFETMRVYQGHIFLCGEHLHRLQQGLKILKITPPYTKKQFQNLIEDVLGHAHLMNARLRLTVWQERKNTHVSILALPYRPHSVTRYKQGFRTCLVRLRKNQELSLPRIKSIDYQPFLKASQLAQQRRCDEAILVNHKGYLVEGSRTNLFLIKDRILFTPSLKLGCLNGITRQVVLRIAKAMAIKIKQGSFSPKDLFQSDEAFCANSILEVMPLTQCENERIGCGYQGSITRQIRTKYYQEVQKLSRLP